MSLFSDWIKRGTRAAQPAAAASKFVQQAIGGHLVSSVVATAVKFFASSGNITGTIKIYGVSK